MTQTTFRQKAFLILFGFFSVLVLLEGFLRLGGFIFHMRQEQSNRASFRQDEVRVLCIGESTTALGGDNSYPALLEKILNETGGKKTYKVINQGMVSKNSRDIYDSLSNHLNRFRPQVVVAMIGVNDTQDTRPVFSQKSWVESFKEFRVYKLFSLLGAHVVSRFGINKAASAEASLAERGIQPLNSLMPEVTESDYEKIQQELIGAKRAVAELDALLNKPDLSEDVRKDLHVKKLFFYQTISSAYRLIGTYYAIHKNYPASIEAFEQSLTFNSTDFATLLGYVRSLRAEKRYSQALSILTQMLKAVPQEPLFLLETGNILSDLGQTRSAAEAFTRLLSLKAATAWIYLETGSWFKNNGYWQEAQEALLKAYHLNTWDYTTLTCLIEVYEHLGHPEKAEVFRREAILQQTRRNKYYPATVENYNRIVDLAQSSGAQVVVMQYPLRQIAPLRAIFSKSGKMIFVENRDNFLAALAKDGFSSYFTDSFAGDFGHCSPIGNRLIAENLARVLLRVPERL